MNRKLHIFSFSFFLLAYNASSFGQNNSDQADQRKVVDLNQAAIHQFTTQNLSVSEMMDWCDQRNIRVFSSTEFEQYKSHSNVELLNGNYIVYSGDSLVLEDIQRFKMTYKVQQNKSISGPMKTEE